MRVSISCQTKAHRRRALIQGLGIAIFAGGAIPFAAFAQATTYQVAVHRDRGCTCCAEWAASLARTGRFRTTLADEANMADLKRRLGVPSDIASCHTAQVDGYVIEGHVPASDILRLLTERPSGVRGLAVPGMPVGSPGMDYPGAAREPFAVFAFRADGSRSVFARHS